jgi:hypothetical protein
MERLLKHIFRTSVTLPVIVAFQVPPGQFNGLLNPVTKILFNVISYTLATVSVLHVTLNTAVVMKYKPEERQRGSKLQDYGLLSCDAV